MSLTQVCDTEITDVGVLRETLKELGVDKLEEHEQPVSLRGWASSRTKAKWVIKANKNRSRFDIGFNMVDGKIKAILESDDRSKLAQDIRSGRLKQCYAKRKVVQMVEKEFRRAKIKQEQMKNGKIRIRVELP